MSRQRHIVLGLLLLLAAASWAALLWPGATADGDMAMASPTMGLNPPLFLAVWVVMMVAMMFPTAAPMVVTFHGLQLAKPGLGEAFVSTSGFVAAYLLVWTLAGVIAYGGARLAETLAAAIALSPAGAARIGGAALIAAGLYQLTPLKDLCLAKCRTPTAFILAHWREGTLGAVRLGFLHGAYCLGCCWLFFVILFPLGLMNVAAMTLVTLVIFVEKSLPWAGAARGAVAAGLIAYGAAVIALPRLLPTFAPGTMMDMPMSQREIAANAVTAPPNRTGCACSN